MPFHKDILTVAPKVIKLLHRYNQSLVVIKLLLNYARVNKIFSDPNIKVGLHQTLRDTSKIIYNSPTKT